MLSVRTESVDPTGANGRPEQHPFFPVSPFKFTVMSFCTFGAYPIYWSYKQWQRIRAREDSDIRPFWRAFFAVIWMFSLLPIIQETAGSRRVVATWNGQLLALLYLIGNALQRLPEPWWLLYFLSVFPLLPAVVTIERINTVAGAREGMNRSFSLVNILLGAVGGITLILALIGLLFPELGTTTE